MKTTCAACGAVSSLDAIIGHEGARAALQIALQIPAPIGKLLVQYLGLFRPAERQLSFARVADLLAQLLPMIQDAKITRNKRIWSAPQEYWRMALEDTIAKRDRLTLPLKNHNYLLAIIESYSNKEEAKQEAQTNAQRSGNTPVGSAARKTVDEVLGPENDRPRSKMPESILKQVGLDKKTGGDDANT